MFILDFMRYFRGYVRFTATGEFVERFLNLIARERIPVWENAKSGDTYSGCVDVRNYRKLRAHAKKTDVRIRVSEKRGVPFTRYKYRHRHGILVGLMIFAVFLFVMSSFIWRIEVNGNGEVTESSIVQVLENLGIAPGTLRSSIDVRDSERRALLLLHELSWVALNIDGSTIYVEVKERVEPPDMVDPSKPCNIVAAADGQILSLSVFDGQPMVAVGDTVRKGDVIVSGIMQDRRGQNLFRHAQAEATATINYEIEAAIPFAYTTFVETGHTRHRGYLDIMGFQLPLFLPISIPHPYHVEREQNTLTLFGAELPFTYLGEDYILMEETVITLTPEEAKAKALSELNAAEKAKLGTAQIHEKELIGSAQAENYVLRGEYLCTMDIALAQEIYVEEDGQEQ
jgi:similar to stage IV sporulation protein